MQFLFMLPQPQGNIDSFQAEAFTPAWVRDAIFYQIFPERFANGDKSNDPPGVEPWGGIPKARNHFGGDLKGILDRLDYVSSLGINAIYLNPIFLAGSNHKYNTTDYLVIDPQFGDEKIFRQLVDSCHARGMKVILDGVFNHTGTEFFAFADVRKHGSASRYASWYNIHSYPVSTKGTPNYDAWWNIPSLPKLMTHNPEVREYLFNVTRHWLTLGIDGWRLDVPNEVPHPFWIEWRNVVKEINPDAYIVGEIWEDATPWLQGDQFDGVMNYRFQKACVAYFAKETMPVTEFDSQLRRTRDDYGSEATFAMQNLLGSHDTERFLTACKNDKAKLQLAWIFQMTYPGAPMVYYGDEIGMSGKKDPGCRGTMIWEESGQDRNLLTTMKQLIAIRNEHEVLRRGDFQTLMADDARNVFAFQRTSDSGAAIVVLNRSGKNVDIDLRKFGVFQEMSWRRAWPVDLGGRVDRVTDSVVVPSKHGLILIGDKIQ